MRTVASAIVTVALLSATSCSKHQPTTPPASASATQIPTGETGPFVVIGHLEHRDRIVTIKSGAQGLVYSVLKRDGKILFENLTAEQLKSESPELHDFIEAATAGQASVTTPQLMMVR
jgi:hypothetical protein